MSVKPCDGSRKGKDEGVVKYRLRWLEGAVPRWGGYPVLEAWRRMLFRLRLIGRDPGRYGGLSYGNVSQRLGRGFVISATQTGGMPILGPEHYCQVEEVDIEDNLVVANGVHPPSSEALTHAAVYQGSAQVQAVLHGHCPEIWRCGRILQLPETPATAVYGTPALALAVKHRVMENPTHGIIVLRGHADGILAYGRSPHQAGWLMVETLVRVWALDLESDENDGGER